MRMSRFFSRFFSAVVTALLIAAAWPASLAQQKPKNKEKPIKKQVLNFDGGIFFSTEGGLSELTCLPLTGRATAPGFFGRFKRVGGRNGMEYRNGQKGGTEVAAGLQDSLPVV